MTIGERMLQYRASHGLTQTDFGNLIGESLSVVFRAESGKHKMHKVNEIRLTNKMNKLEGLEDEQKN